MGKNYVIINDINSKDFSNLLIEELPSMQLPEKKIENIEVDGMDGNLTITDDTYMNTQKTMSCKIYGSEDVDKIAVWLNDCKKIVFSNKPDRYYNAILKGQIDFQRSLAKNRSFQAVFDCQPFGYLLNNKSITVTTNNYSFKGLGSHWCEPKITVYGTGDVNLTVNDTQITLKEIESYITVDSSKKRTYKNSTLLNHKKIGNFPTLSYNNNTISWVGQVNKIVIVPNWRHLV